MSPSGIRSPSVLPLVRGRGRLSTEEAGRLPRRLAKPWSRPTIAPASRFLNGPRLVRAGLLSFKCGAVRGSDEPVMGGTGGAGDGGDLWAKGHVAGEFGLKVIGRRVEAVGEAGARDVVDLDRHV